MIRTPALALAHPVIQLLLVLNVLYAVAIGVLLAGTFVLPGLIERALGAALTAAHPWVSLGLRAIVLVGIVGAVIVHSILHRLLLIVDTVRDGDPFVLDNARRLEAIAWSVLWLEGLRLLVAGIAAATWKPWRVDAFSFAPWLAVLLLFVLAGVFAHGARLRADLEGTV